jgi:cytochrome P450
MAMCLYPEAQQNAQAELDSVLKGRLPEFDDRPSLPYISAIIKETMRWQLVLPLGESLLIDISPFPDSKLPSCVP